MAKTQAQRIRAVRQEELRVRLSNGKHLDHVVEYAKKIAELGNGLESLEVQRLKAAAEIKLKLINKYLPDLKATEITGEGGGAVELTDLTDEQLSAKLRELLDATGKS